MSIGFTLPFAVTTGSLGHFQVTENQLDALENDIRSILMTNWGERVMHFNFGCNFREFLFEPKKNEQLKQQVADRIQSQIALWLPFVVLDELLILFSEDVLEVPENGFAVAMSFRLASQPRDARTTTFLISSEGVISTTTRLSFIKS